ncbi:hypothetical protein ICW40_12450 [Actinotalea ferrariae]|uniref:hypothetical protein n=1 Tax=Actinotalea ferrariae TaxID=1386098 RepID=UPI001C8BC476|nr:hypothetical protein [Actinotalea ferrariae]MBX9245612.1 hypothetical protein [Actinotalea ferrariae]
MSVNVDHAGLTSIASGLRTAGTDLDAATAGAPSSVDAGLASGLVGAILATTADVVVRLAYEADHLAGLVDESNAAYLAGDASSASSLGTLAGSLE